MPLSVHEKLLLAASHIERRGKAPFTAEDLVVAAWEEYPDTFGLQGYSDSKGDPRFPNSNRVFAEIMGSKPIRKQGLLEKTGTKLFRLTEAGRRRASVLDGRPQEATKRATFSREIQQELLRVLESRAFEKHKMGRDEEITFHDASGFWGVSARSSAMQFQARMGQLDGALQAAFDASEKAPLALKHGGTTYDHDFIQGAIDFNAALRERFSTEIAIILSRNDER